MHELHFRMVQQTHRMQEQVVQGPTWSYRDGQMDVFLGGAFRWMGLYCEWIRDESKDEERLKSTKSCVVCDDEHEACIN